MLSRTRTATRALLQGYHKYENEHKKQDVQNSMKFFMPNRFYPLGAHRFNSQYEQLAALMNQTSA